MTFWSWDEWRRFWKLKYKSATINMALNALSYTYRIDPGQKSMYLTIKQQ